MQTKTVYNEVTYAANEAIYGLHLNYKQAVRFVVTNAKIDKKIAKKALEHVMIEYKNR